VIHVLTSRDGILSQRRDEGKYPASAAIVIVLAIIATVSAQAETFTVLYRFNKAVQPSDPERASLSKVIGRCLSPRWEQR
jgi:hypothetical protein